MTVRLVRGWRGQAHWNVRHSAGVEGHMRPHIESIAIAAADVSRQRHPRFPWRTNCTAYRTLVAEFCLQRTGATQATAVFRAFLRRYPSVVSTADESDIAELLTPLGLRHRTVSFVECLRTIRGNHRGRIPRDERRLLALPGVGLYTARAVMCFALGHPVGLLDINIARFLSRAVLGEERVVGRPADRKDLWDISQAISGAASSPAMTQWGLLDIGREICKQKPLCQTTSKCLIDHLCLYHETRKNA